MILRIKKNRKHKDFQILNGSGSSEKTPPNNLQIFASNSVTEEKPLTGHELNDLKRQSENDFPVKRVRLKLKDSDTKNNYNVPSVITVNRDRLSKSYSDVSLSDVTLDSNFEMESHTDRLQKSDTYSASVSDNGTVGLPLSTSR